MGMINSELIRSVIKSSSFYGVVFAFVGAAGIFTYAITHDSAVWNEKEQGDQSITLQLSAFAPPSRDMIADKVEKPKHHKPRKHHHKRHEMQAVSKPIPSDLQAAETPQEKVKPEPQQEVAQTATDSQEAQEAKVATTTQPNPDANANENVKLLRYSDGIENEYLKAIRHAIQKRHVYPPLAIQRGYEGEVHLKFMIDKNGAISNLQIIKRSAYSMLDKAAIKTLKRACKDFPKPQERVYIEIPVIYNIQHS